MSEQVKATKTEATMDDDSRGGYAADPTPVTAQSIVAKLGRLGDEGTRDLAAVDFLTAIDAYASARDYFGVEDDPQVTLAKCWLALEAARTELAEVGEAIWDACWKGTELPVRDNCRLCHCPGPDFVDHYGACPGRFASGADRRVG